MGDLPLSKLSSKHNGNFKTAMEEHSCNYQEPEEDFLKLVLGS